MIDFLMISTRSTKRGVIEIYPKFIIKKSSDLMIRGGDFYAIWLEDRGLWSTDEQDALQLIDRELDKYADENRKNFDSSIKVLHMWDSESGMIDSWHKYCQKQMRDSFHMLDEKLIFSNTPTNKKDYASKRLNYPLEEGTTDAWNKLMSTIYSEEERTKIEWAIGSIVCGESKKLQKFMVLYGAAGTGKSTVLNIIQQLFEGYYSVFDAKALGSSSNSFALEAFKTNPLVAIQHDGDLSRIEDNTRLNSLVSHELMTVNEKFKSTYANRFKCFLFMGTNKPVKITDANKYTDFYNAGKYLVEGFAAGITANTYMAEARARAMARAAAAAAEAELDINSPSKVGYRIGGFFGMGFVNSLIDYADKSYDAGTSVAKSAKEGLRNAVSKIGDFIENGIDSQPTIRPLLDLSDVTEGAGRLSALLSRNQAMKISAGMEREGGSVVQNGGTTPTSGNNYNFTQNNYSPKALSRIDIYRQTKNQFSALKGLVET